jgi:cytochrome c-type biogenesis protein CcmE
MKPHRKQRLMLIGLMLIGIGLAATFALKAFNENLMYFFSTTDVVEGKAPKDDFISLGWHGCKRQCPEARRRFIGAFHTQ